LGVVLIVLIWLQGIYCFAVADEKDALDGQKITSLKVENIRLKNRFVNEKGHLVQRAWADVLNEGDEPYEFTHIGRLHLLGGKTKTEYSLNDYKIYPGEKQTIGIEFRLAKDEQAHSVEFILMNLGTLKDPAYEASKEIPQSNKYTIHHKESYLSRKPSQIMLYVLVPKKLQEDELVTICEEIDAEYKKIQWVSIFIYLDTKEGRKLAGDEFYEPSPSVFEENWLATYDRHPKSGAFINFRPWDLEKYEVQQLKSVK
jgi:hypothetical protein